MKRPEQAAWWRTQLPWLIERLRRHAARYGAKGDAEDLAQETLAALTDTLTRRHGALPPAWSSAETPEDEAAQQASIWTYARTILHRRIADGFKRRAARWRHEVTESGALQEVAGPPHLDNVLRRELLAACVEAIATLPKDELEIVRLAVDGFDLARAMTPAERKRLSRARSRLVQHVSAHLRNHYGIDVEELFEKDL